MNRKYELTYLCSPREINKCRLLDGGSLSCVSLTLPVKAIYCITYLLNAEHPLWFYLVYAVVLILCCLCMYHSVGLHI